MHGLKYWRHLSSTDLVHYTDRGTGIAPDSEWDSHGAYSGSAIADEPSTDGVGIDSDIATEPAPAQRGDTATWHCVSIDGEPRHWITRPVLADMDELNIIVEEG